MRKLKLLSVLVAGIGLFTSMFAVCFASEEPGPKPVRQEIIAARTAYTKTYRNADGTDTIRISTMPLHYLDARKQWQDIDSSVQDSSGENDDDGQPFGYKVLKNTFESFLPKHSQGWVQLRSGNSRLAFKLVTDLKRNFTRLRGKLQANDVLKNCDLNYAVQNGALKEEIVLNSLVHPDQFEYQLKLRNLKIKKDDDGGFLFNDPMGKTIFKMAKFIMYDAKGETSDNINVKIKKVNGKYVLTIVPNKDWINDSKRSFPITIDPTFRFNDSLQTIDPLIVKMYTPCTWPNPGEYYSNGTIQYNNPANLSIKKYSTRCWYKFLNVLGWGPQGPLFLYDSLSVKVWDCKPDGQVIGNPKVINTNSQNNLAPNGEFDILPNKGAYLEIYIYRSIPTSINGTYPYFELTYQNETMSPPAPKLSLLSPETYARPITLNWSQVTDEVNRDAAQGVSSSGIDRYYVQMSTDPTFASAQTFDAGNNTSYTTAVDSSKSARYFFRVYAKDKDSNPLDSTPWDPYNNPSGIRWSNIVSTYYRAAAGGLPVQGTQSKPIINDITPANYIPSEDCYYSSDPNPTIAWSPLSSQTGVTLAVSEYLKDPRTTTVYPNRYFETNANTIKTDWNLAEGCKYQINVQTKDNTGVSPWSDGKLVAIDSRAPLITQVSDAPDYDNSKAYIYLESNEEVKVELYWGEDPGNLVYDPVGSTSEYILYDPAQNKIIVPSVNYNLGKKFYYRLECRDKALNLTTTPVFQLGTDTGNNILNADAAHYGLEGYWNYKIVDLGKAGMANVNLNNGNLVISATDFNLPGRGLPLAMSRYYNSLASYEGILGKGWRTTYEMYLQLEGNDIIINDPDGSTHRFIYVSDTQFTRPAGDYRKVLKNSDGTYQVIEKTGIRYYFGKPLNGVAKLIAIVDRFGNQLTLTYTDGYLTSVQEPSGIRSANFHYETVGGKQYVRYLDFTPLEGSNQSRYITYSYQGDKLTHVRYPFDGSHETDVHYDYDSVVGLLYATFVRLTDSPDESKNATQFAYKSCTRSIASVATSFNTYTETFSDYSGGPSIKIPIVYSFDYDGIETTFTDPNHQKYVYEHYDTGQCKSVLKPTCQKPVTYTYDPDYNLKSTTQSKRVYDPNTGNETFRDVTTEYEYDSAGNLTSVLADKGYQNVHTVLEYEAAYNYVETDLKSVTDPKGNTIDYLNAYDLNGQLVSITVDPPDDYLIVHKFNQYGERTDKDVFLKSNPGVSLYHFSYGYQDGLLRSLTNAYGTTVYEYTVYGERKNITDANGISQDPEIDPRTGNVMALPAPESSGGMVFEPFSVPGLRTLYNYDINGNKTYEYDAKNHNTNYYYDTLNQLYRVESPYIASISRYNSYNRYDANGNLLATSDYSGVYKSYDYDALNRRTKVKDFAGNIEEEYVYDEAGRVKIKYDGKRNQTEYFYDSLDNLLYCKYYNVNALMYSASYAYDANGNFVSKTVPISAESESGMITTTYQYDSSNRPVLINTSCPTNGKYNQTVSYTYEAGQLKTMTVTAAGSNPQLYTYNYDGAQRLESIQNPSGQETRFEYYPGGQRRTKQVYKQSADQDPFMTVNYTYDTAYHLKHLDYYWGSYYIKLGYVYNEIDKITSNTVDYSVNAPAVKNYLLGQLPPDIDEYRRPGIDSLFSGNYTNTYVYDDLGRLTVSDIYGINPGLKYGKSPASFQRQQKTSYSNIDANGNPRYKTTDITTSSESDYPVTKIDTTIESSSYDYLNRLTSQSVKEPEKSYGITLTYDSNGNLIRQVYTDERPSDSIFEYGLDDQMMKSFSETKHEDKKKWNGSENETVDCYNKTSSQYTYELGGRLLRAKTEIYDSTNPYSIFSANYDNYFYYSHDGVIAEMHDDTNNLKVFTRLGGELLSCNDDGSTYFYVQNNRGDVMALVNADGTVGAIRDYDASGEMLCQAPRDRDPFGFTGGLDAGNGMWKLGARFYDSGKGSFIQQDRYMGDPGDPLSLNRYVYCGLDPVNFVDPTGFKQQIIINGSNSTKGTEVSHFTISKLGATILNIGIKVGIGVGTTMATEGWALSVRAARILGGLTALIPNPEVKPGVYTVTQDIYETANYAVVITETAGPEGSCLNGTRVDVYDVDSERDWSYTPQVQDDYEVVIED